MAFWKSDDEKRREIEEVKKQVEGKAGEGTRLPEPPKPSSTETSSPEPPAPQGGEPEEELPPEPPQETEEPIDELEEPSLRLREDSGQGSEIPVTKGPVRDTGDEEFAPLFVKIDKYREVLQDLESVRSSLNDLKQLFELMNEVDNIKRKGMKELREGISDLTGTLVSMDEKFIRPEGTEEITGESTSGVSKTVGELQNQLREIRDSLERIE